MEKNKREEIRIFFSLVLLSLGLMALDKFKLLNWLKRPFEWVSIPIRRQIRRNLQFFRQHSGQAIYNLQFKPSQDILLKDKADKLERENADLKVKLSDLEKENQSLRKMLGASLPASWKFIPASVLNLESGIMTIDKGLDAGIKEGQVVVFENVLVGRVLTVSPRLSKIILPVNKDFLVKAKISETNVKGIVRSEAGENLVLDEVLQEAGLSKDQIVVTSGEDEIYPKNLLIGKIKEILKDETAVYQKAVLESLVDYNQLTETFIVK